MNFDNKTIQDIQDMIQKITDDPSSKNPDKDSIYIYTKQASNKMGKLAQEITYKMIDKKKENGTFVETGGYSGRKCNKRK